MLEANEYRKILATMPIICVDGLIRHENKYLLVRRTKEPLKGQWWVPGGRLLRDENAIDGFRRKMHEELGIPVIIKRFVGIYEDFFEKNEQGVDYIHTVSVVFLAQPRFLEIKLDEQSDAFAWSGDLPKRFKSKLMFCRAYE